MQRSHIVIYSGGMDSYTLLQLVRQRMAPNDSLRALSFLYGQRHKRELACAETVCDMLNVPRVLLDLSCLTAHLKGSSLTDPSIATPHGHYAAANMKQTVVPGRNTLFLAAALSLAEATPGDGPVTIYYGAHAGDHHIYPDCRPDYMLVMSNGIAVASEGRVSLQVPFLHMHKGEILALGLRPRGTTRRADGGGGGLGLSPAAYAGTWTCYEGGAVPCGQCGACQERAEAFAFAGAADPLLETQGAVA